MWALGLDLGLIASARRRPREISPMKIRLKVAAAIALGVPVSASLAMGQAAGVSHPEEIFITTSSEAVTQPVSKPSASTPIRQAESAELKTRPALSASSEAQVERSTMVSMRDDVMSAPNAGVDANVVARVDGPSNQLPSGTLLKVTMGRELTTRSTQIGSEFSGKLVEDVLRDGRVLIPVGSLLSGRVTDVHGGRRVSGEASLHLQPTTVTLPDGTRYTVRGQVVDTNLYASTKVDSEGTIVRRDHSMKTLSAMSLATGSGAAAGAAIGGLPGALIGAGVGAGVSTVVWLKQDRQTALPVDAKVTFILTSPMSIGLQ
jgi:hypothetical protein